LNFLQGPLANLYTTFELQNIAGIEPKPYFPHYYNKAKNLDKKLAQLPAAKYYGEMTKLENEKFMKWYDQNKNTPFNLRESLLIYCTNDVQLLRFCILKM
jgi:hypothetical protein